MSTRARPGTGKDVGKSALGAGTRQRALAAILALLLAGCQAGPATTADTDTEQPSPTETAAPVAPSSSPSVAVASPTPPAPILRFTQQPFEGHAVAVHADTDGWVAVGASETGAPTAWTSRDAVTWTPHAVPDPNVAMREEDGFVGSVMGPMAKWGDTWFSFGTIIGCCDGRGVLAWRSTDGVAWEVIESRSPLFTDGYFVQQLVAHDGGLVAREVGFAVPSGRIWTWTPEGSWMASDLGAFGDGRTIGDFTGLAWDGERFVVVGTPFLGDYQAPPTGGVWVSMDTRQWEALQVPTMSTAELRSVVAVPGGGFLAIGQQDELTAAWGSSDGRTWEPRWLPATDGLGAGSVFEAGDVLVALAFGEDRAAAWISVDGISWSEPGALPALDATGVVAGSAGQIVIIGRERTADGSGQSVLFRARVGE